MAIKRITVSVPEEVARRIKNAAGSTPISTWVTDLIKDHLEDAELERKWLEFVTTVKPRREDIRRADTMFKRMAKSPRRRRAA